MNMGGAIVRQTEVGNRTTSVGENVGRGMSQLVAKAATAPAGRGPPAPPGRGGPSAPIRAPPVVGGPRSNPVVAS